jgi:hypothetical protein
MMTRKQFIAQAIREHERRCSLPPGWWGSWREFAGPAGQTVRFSGRSGPWIVRLNGKKISRHDCRSGALAKARKLV